MQPATVPRTANKIRPQTYKALLGAAEIISLDPRSLQRAWTLILTRSKPLRNVDAPKCPSNEIASRKSAAQTRPLSSLQRKGVKFKFTPHHERIVREMLDELFSPNVLAFPDFEAAISGSRKFRLITDASADRFGAVIEQQFNLYATSEESSSTLSVSQPFLSWNAPRSCELSSVTDKCSTASRLKSRQITSRFKISQVLSDKSNRV